MKRTSMTSFPRSSLGSVLLATSLIIGCGDDEGAFTNEPNADAGDTATTAQSSANDATTDGAPTTSSDVSTTGETPEETTEGTPSETTSPESGATSDDAVLDGGAETSPSEADGSVTDGGNTGADDTDGGHTGDQSSTPGNATSDSGGLDPTGAAACGAQGDVCCASAGGGFGQGTCDEGLTCNNPQGNGLTDSECVVEAPVTGDAGDLTSAACGAEGEVCCAANGGGGFGGGGQGTCDEGLTCNNPAGSGLTNSECVAP